MSKKKVIELIDIARERLVSVIGDSIEDDSKVALAIGCLDGIENELSKPDWISVEDELPPYGEEVLVRDKDKPGNMCFTHRTLCGRNVRIDENCFIKRSVGHITHWRKIDKLEV